MVREVPITAKLASKAAANPGVNEAAPGVKIREERVGERSSEPQR